MKRRAKKVNRPKLWVSLGEQHELRLEGQTDAKLYADALQEKIEYIDFYSKFIQLRNNDFLQPQTEFIDAYSKYIQLKDFDAQLPHFYQSGSLRLCTSIKPVDVDLDLVFKYPAFSGEFKAIESPTVKLYERLRELQEQFRENKCYETLAQIKKLVQELRAITLRKISQTGSYLKSLERVLLYGYKPNRIVSYRRVIQFLFKNMDDESGDALLAHTVVVSNSFNRFKQNSHGFQRTCVG